MVTSTPVELLSAKRSPRLIESTGGSSSVGVPLEDVSRITAEDNSNLGLEQVTFNAGGVWETCPRKPAEVYRPAINAQVVQREISSSSSAPVVLAAEKEVSVQGPMGLIRSVPSRQQSRSFRSPSSATSPPVPTLCIPLQNAADVGDVAREFLNDPTCNGRPSAEGDASQPEGNSLLGVSFEEGNSPITASPDRERSSSPQGTSSKWPTNFVSNKAWSPAISKPSYFSSMKERPRSSSREPQTCPPTPPRSACSTPRRQRGVYQGLYKDAELRNKRRKERTEAKEVDSESQLRASRESSLRATRRYRSSDTRTVLQRSDDHLRRKADFQRSALIHQRTKEEEELQECTFRPTLQVRSIAARRAQDERAMERHLRQLAHKQLDVRARLVQLEREWCRAHRQRKALFSERCKAVQHDRKQEVFDLLNTKEGQEYFWDRVQRLSESGSATSVSAQSRVLQELLQDQHSIIEQQVGDEVDAELQLKGRNLDFGARRNVLLESLEAIEARAQPTIRMLSEMPEGLAILKESGFNEGLANQMRDDVPDPHGGVSRQNSSEKVATEEVVVEVVDSPRARSISKQSPRRGSTGVPQGSVQVSTGMTSSTTLIDTEQPSSRYVSSAASRGSLPPSLSVQPGASTVMTVRPGAGMPMRMVSSSLREPGTPSHPSMTPSTPRPMLISNQAMVDQISRTPSHPSMTPSTPRPMLISNQAMVDQISRTQMVNQILTQPMGTAQMVNRPLGTAQTMPIGTSQVIRPPGTPVSQVVRLRSMTLPNS